MTPSKSLPQRKYTMYGDKPGKSYTYSYLDADRGPTSKSYTYSYLDADRGPTELSYTRTDFGK
jgi:hypothetical protein